MPPAPRADQFPTPPAPRGASEPKAAPRPQPRIVRPIHPPGAPSQPTETQPVTAAAAPATGPEPDLAYGAYQRGYYLSAFNTAMLREKLGDTKAMTLLGELYSNGFGVTQDDNKAAEWYRIAAERGDREAMFALAMFRMSGRGGGQNREEAARLFASAAKLGHVGAAYNLGLLYLEGRLFPQDFKRAAELFQMAAEAGSPEAQYALGTFYKEGRGVMQNYVEAARWLGAAAAADYTDAQVEYAIALFNGTGVEKNEAGAVALLSRAAHKGSPIAQNRLAHVYAAGRVLAADPLAAIKWHLISKAAGAKDLVLDEFMSKQRPEVRAAAERAARPWVDAITQ
jgi:TPR repeat protein